MEQFASTVKLLLLGLVIFVILYVAADTFFPTFVEGVFGKLNGILEGQNPSTSSK